MTTAMTDLAEGWTIEPLTKVAIVSMGQSPPGSSYNSEGQGLPFFQGKAEFGLDHPKVRKWCTAPTRIAEPGDILMSVRAPVGPTNVADKRCAVGRGLAIIRPNAAIPTNLIRHALRLQEPEIASWGTGTTFTAISKRHFEDIMVPIPPEGVRERLTILLDRSVECGRSASEHLVCARALVERLRSAVLAAACSGRLTTDWRESRGDHTSQPPITGSAEPLIETPETWSWVQLQDIADIRGGIQKGAKLKAGEPTREVPYLRVANVQRGWLDLSEIKTIAASESKIVDLVLRPGDILFNEGGDRDKLGRGWVWEDQIEECIHQNHVFRARLRLADMQPRFFSWFGNTVGAGYFEDQGKQTVNLASLSMTKLRELPVPVPSIDEQREIVRRVDELLAVADRLLSRIDTASARVDRSSQAVLAKAFRGDFLDTGAGEAVPEPR